jgi:hypothetical protein
MKIPSLFCLILIGVFLVGCAHLRESKETFYFSESETDYWHKAAVDFVSSPTVWKEHGIKSTQEPLLLATLATNNFQFKVINGKADPADSTVEVTIPLLKSRDNDQAYCVKVTIDRATGLPMPDSLRKQKY